MSQDIAVVVDHLDGKAAEVTFEMLARARALAGSTGGRVLAVAIGHELGPLAAELGAADAVLLGQDARLARYSPDTHGRMLTAVLEARAPRVTLVGYTAMGMDLAAASATALGWPLVAYCRDVRVEGDGLVAVSQLYGGKILAETEVDGPHAIVEMVAGATPAAEGRRPGQPAVEEVTPPELGAPRVRFKRLLEPEAGDVDLTRESVIVSVGRGIQSRDNLGLVEDLARALGGALAASRPIVDQGWLAKTRQVGKSGMTVKPKLYLAVGISGAPEHLEGMRGAELIVAINSDPGAPIFGVAHYGIAGDLFDVVPALTDKLGGSA